MTARYELAAINLGLSGEAEVLGAATLHHDKAEVAVLTTRGLIDCKVDRGECTVIRPLSPSSVVRTAPVVLEDGSVLAVTSSGDVVRWLKAQETVTSQIAIPSGATIVGVHHMSRQVAVVLSSGSVVLIDGSGKAIASHAISSDCQVTHSCSSGDCLIVVTEDVPAPVQKPKKRGGHAAEGPNEHRGVSVLAVEWTVGIMSVRNVTRLDTAAPDRPGVVSVACWAEDGFCRVAVLLRSGEVAVLSPRLANVAGHVSPKMDPSHPLIASPTSVKSGDLVFLDFSRLFVCTVTDGQQGHIREFELAHYSLQHAHSIHPPSDTLHSACLASSHPYRVALSFSSALWVVTMRGSGTQRASLLSAIGKGYGRGTTAGSDRPAKKRKVDDGGVDLVLEGSAVMKVEVSHVADEVTALSARTSAKWAPIVRDLLSPTLSAASHRARLNALHAIALSQSPCPASCELCAAGSDVHNGSATDDQVKQNIGHSVSVAALKAFEIDQGLRTVLSDFLSRVRLSSTAYPSLLGTLIAAGDVTCLRACVRHLYDVSETAVVDLLAVVLALPATQENTKLLYDVLAIPVNKDIIAGELGRLQLPHVERLLVECGDLICALSLGPLQPNIQPPPLPRRLTQPLRVTVSQAVSWLGCVIASHWSAISLSPEDSPLRGAAEKVSKQLKACKDGLVNLASLEAQLQCVGRQKAVKTPKAAPSAYAVEEIQLPFD